jgi:iron(III) transport system substrate-binding protein
MRLKNIHLFLIILAILSGSVFAKEVNIYTSRHYDSDTVLYENFTNETGIKVNIISSKSKALLERLRSEGENSPADIFITVDAGNLWKAQEYGLFRKINSKKIDSIVPKNLRGKNNEWIALAKRARVLFYNPKKYSDDELKDLRSSNNLYNQSLVASMIVKHGESFTEEWAKGLVNNFARKPQGNDRAQIIAVANGEADLAIANSYYLGLMLSGKKGEKQLNAGKKVKILFPSQNDAGAHINISGAGIIKSSKNYNNAIQFLEFMLSEKAQRHLVENTYEYPINKKVKPSALISQFGLNFKEDFTDVYKYGEFNSAAIKLMDRIGWE